MQSQLTTNLVRTGRRSSITPEHIHCLEQCFQTDLSISDACLVSGVSRDAYYRRCNTDSNFRTRMEFAQMFLKMRAKQVIFAKIVNEHDIKTSRWFLERRDPEFMPSAKIVAFAGQVMGNWNLDQLYKIRSEVELAIDMRLNYQPSKIEKKILRQLRKMKS